LFHCFSRDEGGDVVRFYELMHGVSFGRAVRELAARLNLETKDGTRHRQIPMRFRAAPDAEAESEPLDPEQTPRICTEFLRLCAREDQHEGRNYLLRRGINAETIERAAIAYFPRRAYSRVMRGMGSEFPASDLQRSGIFNRRAHLTFYRHRLLFPFIREDQAIYLQARTIAPGVEPRWHNMRGAIPMLYNASALADLADNEIVYLVEGFTDTLTLLSHNFCAVGLVGAGGLREEWMPALKSFRVVSVLDPDAAGERATSRYAEMFAARGMQLANVSLPSDVNDFFRTRATAALELALLTEAALEGKAI
jgi:DNA primase